MKAVLEKRFKHTLDIKLFEVGIKSNKDILASFTCFRPVAVGILPSLKWDKLLNSSKTKSGGFAFFISCILVSFFFKHQVEMSLCMGIKKTLNSG